MSKTILVTGGAGFIGSHLVDELIEGGHNVRVLDRLVPQVHGESARRPDYLNGAAELIIGDVRDASLVAQALRGVDVVYHLAARVGVGQSMYQPAEYVSENSHGTATLLHRLLDGGVERLVVASSMSIYGEGLYRARDGTLREQVARGEAQLSSKQWEPLDERGHPLAPVPTHERKQPSLESVYALTKYDQERLCLLFGRAYGIPTFALRLFNVYGTRQALSNPYTGVLAIFAARLLNRRAPLIFEDGEQRRDFVHVRDVAHAFRSLLVVDPRAEGTVLNIGSGRVHTIREVALELARALKRPSIAPDITREHRRGDIRHCFADISAAARLIGYRPRVEFARGLVELAKWLKTRIAVDHVDRARGELVRWGLTA